MFFINKARDPNIIFPISGINRLVFLKNIIKNPQIIVGDYTYYDDPEDVYNFEKNVLYLVNYIGDKLIIGKFCQIASGVKFLMNGGNHLLSGISTYPFKILTHSSLADFELISEFNVIKGDTIVGNDVWIGNSATIMPGVKIGDGAVIGTNSLVTKDVEPYTIVGGNPAREIRKRFSPEDIEFLLNFQWWNLPIDQIAKLIKSIVSGNIDDLRKNQ